MTVSYHTDVERNDLTVLIVEDEPVSRMALSNLLSAYGYRTAPVASAEEALELLETPRSDDAAPDHVVALVDLDLPGMNGQQFIEEAWKHDPSMPAVLITAANGERVRPIVDRGVPHLRKPVDVPHLLSILAEARHLN